MDLAEYIDFEGIYAKAKQKHLEQFPTAQEYIDFLEDIGEPSDYVLEMYEAFSMVEHFNPPNSNIYDSCDFLDLENDTIWIVFYDECGDSHTITANFKINLEEEFFCGYY